LNITKEENVKYMFELDQEEFEAIKSLVNKMSFDPEGYVYKFQSNDQEVEALSLFGKYVNSI